MIERIFKLDDLTTKEIADEIANMDSEEQVELINEIGRAVRSWKALDIGVQLSWIKDDMSKLNDNGKWIVEKIKEYLG